MAGPPPPGDPLEDVAERSANDTALLLAKFDEAIAAALEDVAPPPPQTSARPPLHSGPVDRAGSVQGVGGGGEAAGDSGWFTPKRENANAGGGREAVGDEGGSGWFTPKKNIANPVDDTLLVTPGGGRFTRTGHGSPESADAPPGGGGRAAPSNATTANRDLAFSKGEESPRGRVRAGIHERERRQRVLLPLAGAAPSFFFFFFILFTGPSRSLSLKLSDTRLPLSSGDRVAGSNPTGAEYPPWKLPRGKS